MRKLFLSLLFIVSSILALRAQQNHFIYIQAESNQPFYVKLNKKLYSSSASGYLILPKLLDGSYDLQVGFPKNEWPEQSLTCTINKKDIGYLLKNFGEKGWGLFDLQTLNITMAKTKEKKEEVMVIEKDDPFSNMLSTVVNDPTIKQKEVVAEVRKEESIQEVAKIQVTEPVTTVVLPEPIQRTIVTRLMMSNGKDGTEMIYVDLKNGIKDTIRVFIPADKKLAIETKSDKKEDKNEPIKEEAKKEVPVIEPEKQKELKQEKKQPIKEKVKFIDFDKKEQIATEEPKKEKKNKEDKSTVAVTPVTDEKQTVSNTQKKDSPTDVNPNCKGLADEEDFLKLRKKMASAKNDDRMLNSAMKAFKSKCFTTEQIGNLCVLFLNDEGRYKFFDAAYSFISDKKNFASLQNQLTDKYFINRFKAMIQK